MRLSRDRNEYPVFQVWRLAALTDSTMYNRIGEVQLQSDYQVTGNNNDNRKANIILTGNNTIEVQSGDVVGYYHPPDARYRVRTVQTDGYIQYEFDVSSAPSSVNLDSADSSNNEQQPLIEFTIGRGVVISLLFYYTSNHYYYTIYVHTVSKCKMLNISQLS